MLSGAFVIKEENGNFNTFYTKTFLKIIVPTLIFSVIYVLMHYAEIFFAVIFHIPIETDKKEVWSPLLNWLKGQPTVTLWYMYMIIPLYLVTPVIIMIKKVISVEAYRRLAVIMIIYGILVSKSCTLSWILQFAAWLGYFMLGDVIREWGIEICNIKKNHHYRMIGGGLIIIAYILLTVYWYAFSYKANRLMIPDSFSWIVIAATLLQFTGVSMIQVKQPVHVVKIIAEYSLDIYLIHPIFCEIGMQLFGRILKWFPDARLLPVYSFIIAGVSGGAAALWQHPIKRWKNR